VTCSYNEVLRFKSSAASATSHDVTHLCAITDSAAGLIQAVADNFDANISLQKGLRSTHALALLLTQEKKQSGNSVSRRETITRIRKDDLKKDMNSDVDVQHYQGPKKPNMPASEATLSVYL
jgi:hypothetical protein